MAQASDNNNLNTPPATGSNSISPSKDINGGDASKSSSHMVGVGAIDKGKGVVKIEQEDECGRSEGKLTTRHAVATARDGKSGGRYGARELHIVMERERRKRMSEMFTKLHGLLPTLPNKVDKSSIVMEAIHYIKSLEGTLSELQSRKMEMQLARGNVVATTNGTVSSLSAAPGSTSLVAPAPVVLPNVGILPPTGSALAPGTVNMVTASLKPVGLRTWSGPNIVLSLSGNDAYINMCVARRPGFFTMVLAVLEKYSIDVVTSGISSDNARSMFNIHTRINGTSNQFGDNVLSEEIYKMAVSEIMLWLSA